MTASDLTEWVALFLPDLVPDGQGGFREVPPAGLVYDTPAKVQMITRAEVTASDQVAQRIRCTVTIRYETPVTAAHRVWWQGRYLDVEGAPDNLDMASEWLALQCTQKELGQS